MPHLILPELKYWNSFQSGLKQFQENPAEFDTVAVKQAFEAKSFEAYDLKTANARQGKDLPEGFVPSTSLWLIDKDEFVGLFDVRHYLTPALELCVGHIGYAVVPSARGKGYAKEGLKLCCMYAASALNLDKVMVACNSKNPASYRVMRAIMNDFGGYEDEPFINEVKEVRKIWIEAKGTICL